MTSSASPSSRKAAAADRYLTVGDAPLRYRDEGCGPAVILVHGWTLDLEMWHPQVAALADAFRLVRFDRRGHGLSGGRPAGEHDAADIAALCAHLRLGQVSLIGMSQGARSVLAFASSAPARVGAIVLDGPPACDLPAVDDDVPTEHFRHLVRSQGLEAFRREWSAHPLMQLRTPDPEMRRLLNLMIERYPGHDLAGRAPLSSRAAPATVNSVRAPALVLSGAHDLASRVRAAKHLSKQLPCAEHRMIAGAGHLANLDRPAHYSELCRTFLARHSINPAQ